MKLINVAMEPRKVIMCDGIELYLSSKASKTHRCDNFFYRSVKSTMFFPHNSSWMELDLSFMHNSIMYVLFTCSRVSSNKIVLSFKSQFSSSRYTINRCQNNNVNEVSWLFKGVTMRKMSILTSHIKKRSILTLWPSEVRTHEPF